MSDWVMVPRDCTDEIAEAICGQVNVCGGIAESIWRAAVTASQAAQPAEADGWVMVPREPTAAMVEKFYAATEITREGTIRHFVKGWSAMLAATPKAPAPDSDPWFQLGWYKERLASAERERDTWKERAMALRLATPPAPNDDLRAALESIAKFVEDFLAPWGSWKTAWWEGEVSDDAAFTPDNALKHIANVARRAALKENRRG